ncbi:UNVERIFIED_CONTAM: ABC-type multidrug transport system permease subunit [Brevibacillus sp. OAP136]
MKLSKAMLFYYLIITLLFFGGRMYIVETYHMEEGPVALEAFHRLFSWVNLFAWLYIIPLLSFGFWQFKRYFSQRVSSLPLRIVLSLLYIGFAAAVGYFLLFLFILLFYGFAP